MEHLQKYYKSSLHIKNPSTESNECVCGYFLKAQPVTLSTDFPSTCYCLTFTLHNEIQMALYTSAVLQKVLSLYISSYSTEH